MSTEMSRRYEQDKDFLLSLGTDPQSAWDSEKRSSPYSTVSDPSDETCECCGGSGCEDCTS
jgi:hypothetical protein